MNRLPHWKKISLFGAAGFFFFGVLLFTFGRGYAQQIAPAKPGQKVHAIVIGISKYKDKRIPALQFADRDARLFVDFLRSPSGGNVPSAQISLLLNEKATFSEIDNAIADLYESASPGDRVYFYFSGHGDVENQTYAKLGFLLAYNTPANNYIRNAIRLEDINLMARTLSTQKNAEVILITDACRSGNLAGGLKGSRVVGESLRRVERNEVRFASCLPNQLSQESAQWGGGRGVFSYYLLNGLYGAAAKPGSNGVAVSDLKNFLSNSLASDKILRAANKKQQPIISGNLQLRISEKILPTVTPLSASAVSQMPNPLDIFKSQLRSQNMEELIDFSNLKDATADSIRNRVFYFFSINIKEASVYHAFNQLVSLCSTSKNAANRTNAEIASFISEKGQEVISDYLVGDMAELERRNYYNIKNGEYDRYVNMYAAALKLLPKNHTLYERIQVASLYFEGLLCRLKMPLFEDSKHLLDKAMVLQQAALKLEPFAAYIHNELANLNATKGRVDSARYHYDYASKIAPTWAVPVANLAGLYNYEGNIKKAKEIADRARELQPDLVSLMVNEGVTAELEKNWLRAEEMQLRGIVANSRHYLSYERLGYVYTSTTQFKLADSLFFEAFQRKKGYFFPKPDSVIFPSGAPALMNMPKALLECPPSIFPDNVDNAFLLTVAGKNNTYFGQLAEAEFCFKRALVIDPDNFFTAYYYARCLLLQKKYGDAEYYFKKSYSFYKSGSVKDIMGGKYPPFPPEYGMPEKCYIQEIEYLQYDSSITKLFLLQVYEATGYISQAEAICHRLIGDGDLDQVMYGYIRLANIFKQAGQWKNAERVLLEYDKTFKEISRKDVMTFIRWNNTVQWGSMGVELDTFYQEVIDSFPEHEYWAVQSAHHWYQKIMPNINDYYFEDRSLEDSIAGISDSIWGNWGILSRNLMFEQEIKYNQHPGVGISFPELVEFPFRVCVSNIQRAIPLATTDETIAELHSMLGNIFFATRQFDKAAEQYQAAIEFRPDDAGLRRMTASAFQQSFRLTNAFNHLDTLWQKNLLLANDYLPFAAMAIHGKQFVQVAEVLENASQLFTGIKKDSVMALKARMYFVQQDARSVPYYTDSIQKAMPLPERLYAVASMYAIKSDPAKAFQWLNQALEKGFDYGYVLENDPVWAMYRNKREWNDLLKGRQFKTYPITDFSKNSH